MATSLKGGVILQTEHRAANTEIHRLERNATCEDALSAATLAGNLSMGIVPCGEGFALRYAPSDRREVIARIRPDMTRTCGREVMLADSSDGKLYIVKGACKAMRGEVLMSHLANMMGWKARWERVIGKTQHTTTHLVFATEPPKMWASMLRDPMSREIFPITIDIFKKEPEHKRRLSLVSQQVTTLTTKGTSPSVRGAKRPPGLLCSGCACSKAISGQTTTTTGMTTTLPV